jgi:hypothetical protein
MARDLPAVFRAETVFHLVQSLILALRLPQGQRPVFSLDTTLKTAVDVPALETIGDVLFEERPKTRLGRLKVVASGVLRYPFLRAGHEYYGPILNRPAGLLRRYGRARHITLLNEGRFSDAGPIRGRRNQIYHPAVWKCLSGYFVHARNRAVHQAVFTETSAPERPDLGGRIQELFLDIEAELSAAGSPVQAAHLSVFGHQILHEVSDFSTLAVLPFVETLDGPACDQLRGFLARHDLDPARTLFKIHPRTRVPADQAGAGAGLSIETGTYPIELLLLSGHMFDQAYFINTSTNLKTISKEKIFLEAL